MMVLWNLYLHAYRLIGVRMNQLADWNDRAQMAQVCIQSRSGCPLLNLATSGFHFTWA
jgi:hypothetical protein